MKRRQFNVKTKDAQARNFMEVFRGAQRGGFNGMFFLPIPLNTSRQMPQLTRHEIARKSIMGYNNIPEIRAVIDGLAIDEVDTALWPKSKTSNRIFSKAVTNRFHEENKDPRLFDLRQQDSFYGAQFLIRRTIRLLGDLFGQLVRSPFGPPRMSFLPGYQCTNDGAPKDDKNLRDGIRHDPETDAPLFYRFAVPKKTGSISSSSLATSPSIGADYVELPAGDVLHFHDPFLSDQDSRYRCARAGLRPDVFHGRYRPGRNGRPDFALARGVRYRDRRRRRNRIRSFARRSRYESR
jgi:hypothetical protein